MTSLADDAERLIRAGYDHLGDLAPEPPAWQPVAFDDGIITILVYASRRGELLLAAGACGGIRIGQRVAFTPDQMLAASAKMAKLAVWHGAKLPASGGGE